MQRKERQSLKENLPEVTKGQSRDKLGKKAKVSGNPVPKLDKGRVSEKLCNKAKVSKNTYSKGKQVKDLDFRESVR